MPLNIRQLSPPAIIFVALAALVLATIAVGADYAQPQQQDQFANQRPDYDQQQMQQHQQQQHNQAQSKAKKIQIVYIKVPLAKLKPSLANEYVGGSESATIGDNSTYAAQHNKGQQDATETKSQGSQSADQQQQQQLSNDENRQQHQSDQHQQQLSRQHSLSSSSSSSFLIPMAVVQPSEGYQSAEQSHLSLVSDNDKSFGSASNSQSTTALSSASTQLAQMSTAGSSTTISTAPSNVFQSNGRQSRQQQSPMQHYQQQFISSPSVNHGINHGFMSSFLLGEKEKMAAGVMGLQQQQTPVMAATAATANTQTSISPLTAPTNTESNHPNQKQQATAVSNKQQGSGGLMPIMMAPFSHMPDNMIGQAYNAAVGQALPIESGSPASMLSSPSVVHADTNKRDNNYGGGNAGTVGDSGSSLGIASSGSYGSNGQSQQDTSSLGNAFQHSASGFVGSAPSSGYGNGINSFGASVAFSDYPAAQSSASEQQTYSQQQFNNNNNNHHLSQSSENGPADSHANQKLRQAKKTIIPIVVQVEHAILENNGASLGGTANYNANNNNNLQQTRGNKYGGRSHRQLGGSGGGGKRNRKNKHTTESGYRNSNQLNVPYGAATNELGSMSTGASGAQYINAANAQDINQITAAINAENAASAAAALAQADSMTFGNTLPAYMQSNQGNPRPHHQGLHGHNARPAQYANGLQSAASVLLANTHPVIQAAASGGLASVSKLGAKLGEIMALPSMQVPNTLSSISSSLPSAFSSITNQMGVQLNQAVQQVAKEHPNAHAFARQVAQHAGLNLPNFNGPSNGLQHQHNNGGNPMNQQQVAAASNQYSQSMSPQAQLQNLKLSIGQNLQTAAAQLIGVHQKANAQSAASLLSNPLVSLYPPSMNAALKQLSGISPMSSASSGFGSSSMQSAIDPHHAQSSSIVPVQQQLNSMQLQQQFLNQQQQQQQGQTSSQVSSSDHHSPTSQSGLVSSASETVSSGKPVGGKSTFKSKFLSFFQPPKFISNLLSWNDRADARNDFGLAADQVNKSNNKSKEEGEEEVEESAALDESQEKNSATKQDTTSSNREDLASKSANATKSEHLQQKQEAAVKVAPVSLTNSSSNATVDEQPKVVKAEVASSAPANSTSTKN